MLYVNGDSWTKPTPGVDLLEVWPQLVADKLNLDLVNQGIGCGSNIRILNCLENLYFEPSRPDRIIIALNGDSRFSLPAPEMDHWNISAGYARLESTSQDDQTIARWWVENSFDPVDSLYRYYKILWNLHNICLKFGCPYFMFQIWDNELANLNLLGGEEKVAKFLEKYYPNENAYFRVKYANAFKELSIHSQNWNYVERPPIMTSELLDGPRGHPNKEGHKKIAEFVLQHI